MYIFAQKDKFIEIMEVNLMSCIVNMIRYDEKNVPFLKQEFDCPISIDIIKQLMEIETAEWHKFCFAPFNSLSKFIIANINRYPLLKPYITIKCQPFDFSYQYITDISSLSKTIFTNNISTHQNKFYIEKWIVYDYLTHESICFFELEHTNA